MEQLVKDYIEQQVGWAESTKKVVSANLTKICRLLNSNTDNLNGEFIFKQLKNAGYKLYTIQTYMTLARSFELKMFKTAKIDQFLKENRYVFRNAYQDKTTNVTPEKFNEILDKASCPDMFNALVLMGKTGLRKSEVFRIKWTDVNENNFILVLGKGGKRRKVPALKTWFKNIDSDKVSGTVSPTKVSRYLKIFKVTPHDLRAYYATQVTNKQGLNIKDASLVLGHSSVTTTQRYVRSDYNKVSSVLLGEV